MYIKTNLYLDYSGLCVAFTHQQDWGSLQNIIEVYVAIILTFIMKILSIIINSIQQSYNKPSSKFKKFSKIF